MSDPLNDELSDLLTLSLLAATLKKETRVVIVLQEETTPGPQRKTSLSWDVQGTGMSQQRFLEGEEVVEKTAPSTGLLWDAE